MTTKRPLTQPDQVRIYVYDRDYRCDPWNKPSIYDQSTLSFKQQHIAAPPDQNTNDYDEQPLSQPSEEDTHGSTKTPVFPDEFPASLNSIKEYIAEKDGDTYIPLHSFIILKKRRGMLYLQLEFGEITMDGLVDSWAFINAMSWSNYNAIKTNSDNCIIKEYPQPPFKIEWANAQLEQPIATADIQFNIGTYTFTDTLSSSQRRLFP